MKQNKLFRTIARIWFRGFDKKDGLFVGIALKGTRDILKPGTVYELRELMGEIVLKEVGKSCIGNKPGGLFYGYTIGDIIGALGGHIILTKEEYQALCDKDNKKENKHA